MNRRRLKKLLFAYSETLQPIYEHACSHGSKKLKRRARTLRRFLKREELAQASILRFVTCMQEVNGRLKSQSALVTRLGALVEHFSDAAMLQTWTEWKTATMYFRHCDTNTVYKTVCRNGVSPYAISLMNVFDLDDIVQPDIDALLDKAQYRRLTDMEVIAWSTAHATKP